MNNQERDAYYSDYEHLSRSMMTTFEDRPSLFHAIYVARTLPPVDATQAMLIGRLTHTLTLEPHTFDRDWTVLDFADWRSHTSRSEAAVVAAEGKTAVLPKELEPAQRIADAVRSHPEAIQLLEADNARYELPIRWEHLGVKRKSRLDVLIEVSRDHAIIVDLKTAACCGPEQWAKHCWTYGYRKQAAWYRDAALSLGFSRVDWIYIVVEKDPPHDVYVYQATDGELMLGRMENEEIVRQIAACHASGVWARPEQIGVHANPLPHWVDPPAVLSVGGRQVAI